MNQTPGPVQSLAQWATQHSAHLGESARWPADLAQAQLRQFEGWALQLDAQGQPQALWRKYTFSNFEGVKLALHELLHLADDEDHHPEVKFAYSHLEVHWNTHSAGGLSNNDWVCAARLDLALKHLG